MRKLFVVIWIGVLLTGCGGEEKTQPAPQDDGRLTVAAVNYPLAYFAERIGGDLVEIVYPVARDMDPAFWSPSATEVEAFQRADLILLNGADYAKWVPKVTLSENKMVNTSASFADHYIPIEDAVTHAHGPGGDHAHKGTAFTTWLDLTLAAAQAEAIRAAFVSRRPEDGEVFSANFASLEKDLLDLDGKMTALMVDKSDQPLVASHPVYQYLARRYGLNLQAVMWEPGELPAAAQWRELESILEVHRAVWMIWEGEPLPATTQRLEQMGVTGLVFAPCMNTPEDGDFLSVMRDNIRALQPAFR
jgi:zinc transport system substrate-binding protein